jgi:hypothetical protein
MPKPTTKRVRFCPESVNPSIVKTKRSTNGGCGGLRFKISLDDESVTSRKIFNRVCELEAAKRALKHQAGDDSSTILGSLFLRNPRIVHQTVEDELQEKHDAQYAQCKQNDKSV